SSDDNDPGDDFSTVVTVPASAVGSVKIGLVAKDATGNIKIAPPVWINVIVPGNVALQRIDAEKVSLLSASPAAQLHVYGNYSDGIRREITRAPGITYEMDAPDPRKSDYPYNGTGVAEVDASGVITGKTHGTTICHVNYAGLAIDVVIEVAE